MKRRGFLNPEMVRSISFWITSACILVAVLASLLAIWKFAGTDILWRTVATCAVIGSGTVAFYWVNVLFGNTSDLNPQTILRRLSRSALSKKGLTRPAPQKVVIDTDFETDAPEIKLASVSTTRSFTLIHTVALAR